MRGSFAWMSIVVSVAAAGSIGCSGAATTDIEAGQHGKRLNLVDGEDTRVDAVLSPEQALVSHAGPTASARTKYRDVAGVVLVSPIGGAQSLEQWLLLQDGTEFVTRTCPVNANRGVDFAGCAPWSSPSSITELGLRNMPIRSLSTYLFPEADGSTSLAQVVFDMSGEELSERTCPVAAGAIDWTSCSDWAAAQEDASAIGIPQENAFSDEVVVSYVNDKGERLISQELVSASGSGAWSRTCVASEAASSCAFSGEMKLSDLGIHYDTIEGIGGYTYTDGDALVYAQTVIGAEGTSASRRICPVTPAEGVQFDKCHAWQGIELGDVTTSKGSIL